MKKIAEVNGSNGDLIVCEDCLIIERNNFSGLFSGFKQKDRVKHYYYRDISHIDFRKPSIWGDGYFRVNMPYTAENPEAEIGVIMGANQEMISDPYTVVVDATFFKKKSEEMQEIYELIMRKMTRAKSSSRTVISTNSGSRMDELKKLADLKEMGVLTQAEFEREKQRILNS